MPTLAVVYGRFRRSNAGTLRSVYEVTKIVLKRREIQKVD